jgi:hypothetical protein
LEAEIGRILVQGQPRQIVWEIPIFKITRAKWMGDMAEAVDLVCNYYAPSSNTSPTKKKKKKKSRWRVKNSFPGDED